MLDSLLVFKNKGEDGAIPLNADNVNYNFNLIKQLLNVFHPIGEYFETSDINFDQQQRIVLLIRILELLREKKNIL